MNRHFLNTLALAMLFLVSQNPVAMAQSIQAVRSKPKNGSLPAILHIPMKYKKGVRSDTPSEAVVLGLAKQKVYAFRTVDYPAATWSVVSDYNAATAVGFYVLGNSDGLPFYFKGTTNYPLPLPAGAVSASINGISSTGVMVGTLFDNKGHHGFIWDGKTFTILDYPNGRGITDATGINKTGVVVGDYYDNSDAQHGFMYSKGTYTSIDFPGAWGTVAAAINSNGDVVGTVSFSSATNGFLLSKNVYTTIDFPMSKATYAAGINDAGEIAGSFQDSLTMHGFTYTNGAFAQIDVGGGSTATMILHIENNKNVVGNAIDAAGESHGIIGK
jgi:uncharacterized membrane protein